MKRLLGLLICGTVLQAATPQSHTLTIGGQAITLALPDGLEEVRDEKPAAWTAQLPPSIDHVIAEYRSRDRSSGVVIQTMPGFDGPGMPLNVLAGMLSTFTDNIRHFAKADRDDIEKNVAPGPEGWVIMGRNRRVNRALVIEFLSESKAHVSVLMLMPTGVKDETSKDPIMMVASLTQAIVRERMIYIYFYKPLTGKGTFDEVRSMTKESIDRTLKTNR